MPIAVARGLAIAAMIAALPACDRAFRATAEERVGYLRELVRARTVSRDTLPIDACSVNRFMDEVPAWRDSLVQSERAKIIEAMPCPTEIVPVPGRFVIMSWYRNWSGEYVIRGASYPWDEGYRFTDGIYVGREKFGDREYFAGTSTPRAAPSRDSVLDGMVRGDSIRRGGSVSDSTSSPRPDE